MFQAPPSPYLVPFDGSFMMSDTANEPPEGTDGKKKLERELKRTILELRALQQVMYASNKTSVLLMFQAMDAAGKDGTIKKVMTGVNPAGCQVFSFKQPSSTELDHDFLWRCYRNLPERGRIGIFNRSWYEEVLVVRVHPEYLDGQRLPWRPTGAALWAERLESIHDLERHLARNGTVILKFFLNVSPEEQKRRFLDRIDQREKNWKFSEGDVRERGHWDSYMDAYEGALRGTSRSWAPWYAIPADNKRFMRLTVAKVLVAALQSLDLSYPVLDATEEARLAHMRQLLLKGD